MKDDKFYVVAVGDYGFTEAVKFYIDDYMDALEDYKHFDKSSAFNVNLYCIKKLR